MKAASFISRHNTFTDLLQQDFKNRKEIILMSSKREYLDFILEQLSELSDISYRAMMGEYIIYYQGRVIGGIYDDRFLVKDTPPARRLMPDIILEIPYEGAKKMLLVEDIENRVFLRELFETMVDELPLPKNKSKQEVRNGKT